MEWEGLRPHYTADITEKGKEVKPSRKATDYGVPLGVLYSLEQFRSPLRRLQITRHFSLTLMINHWLVELKQVFLLKVMAPEARGYQLIGLLEASCA